jgi:hypothetical protein
MPKLRDEGRCGGACPRGPFTALRCARSMLHARRSVRKSSSDGETYDGSAIEVLEG